VVIDSGADTDEIDLLVADNDLELRYVLCTHHHYDHVANNQHYRQQHRCQVCSHRNESNLIDGEVVGLEDNQVLKVGDIEIQCLHVPGHTSGQLAFLVNERKLFTGDTLFAGSVGGTKGPDHTSFSDLRHSILEIICSLPPSTEIFPGHMEPSTIGYELQNNPFLRAWQGIDKPALRDCTVDGEPYKLLLRAADYDGGTKCWVQASNGTMDVIAGSKVID
jgi:glyoxylase-like metal-dependent hydrolase (beta-lactamase superfamily II)